MTTQEKEEFMKNMHAKLGSIVDDFNGAFPPVKDEKGKMFRGGGVITLAFTREGKGMISSSSIVGGSSEIVEAILETSMRDKAFGEIIIKVYNKLNKYITAIGSDEYLNLIEKEVSKREKGGENVNA